LNIPKFPTRDVHRGAAATAVAAAVVYFSLTSRRGSNFLFSVATRQRQMFSRDKHLSFRLRAETKIFKPSFLKRLLNLIFNNRYLRTGTRRVQKRKTATIKASSNPDYHAKLTYNACNVMGNIFLSSEKNFFLIY